MILLSSETACFFSKIVSLFTFVCNGKLDLKLHCLLCPAPNKPTDMNITRVQQRNKINLIITWKVCNTIFYSFVIYIQQGEEVVWAFL